MSKDKMKEIIQEEIEKHNKRLQEGDYDQVEKKAGVLKGVADFAKAVEKFESAMTIEMANAFSDVLVPLKSLLSDVGSNPDSFLDKIRPGRRSVVLKKAEGDAIVTEGVFIPCQISEESVDENTRIDVMYVDVGDISPEKVNEYINEVRESLLKKREAKALREEIRKPKFYDSLEEAVKSKTQNK